MSDVDPKFEGATEPELAEYVEGSAQRPGESDTAWAARVRAEEAELLTKLAARKEKAAAPDEAEVTEPAE